MNSGAALQIGGLTNPTAPGRKGKMKEKFVTVTLEKAEIEVLRHALYIHRETVRSQRQLSLEDKTGKARRDASRFDTIIRKSLKLDDKLSDALV